MKHPQGPAVFDEFPSYRGGATTLYGGYVWEFCPGHHLQNRWGFVAQHRLVAEDTLGRPLQKGEHVHHLDEVRTNNDPENLHVLSKSAHHKHHAAKRAVLTRANIDRREVERALEQFGALKTAARHLGVHHQTLRNRFPELCWMYQRSTPANLDDPELIEAVLQAAPDRTQTLRDVAARLHVSTTTVSRICSRRGVPWLRRSRVGELHATYRGKPTPRALAAGDSHSESA